jgi:hypothetical protein
VIALGKAALGASMLAWGCTTVESVSHTQTLDIHAQPADAEIWRVEGGERTAVGVGQAKVKAGYVERVLEFDRSCWITALVGAAASLFGASLALWNETRPTAVTGGVLLSLGSVTAAAALGACVAGAQVDGRVVSPAEHVTFVASKPGYAERAVTLALPLVREDISIRLEPMPPSSLDPPRVRDDRRVVVIFDLEDRSQILESSERSQLGEFLAAQVAATTRFRVVPREVLRAKLVRDKEASFRACFDEKCQVELGKALAAQDALATRLMPLGDRCVLTALLYDLRAEATSKGSSVNIDCDAGAVLLGLSTLAARLGRPARPE